MHVFRVDIFVVLTGVMMWAGNFCLQPSSPYKPNDGVNLVQSLPDTVDTMSNSCYIAIKPDTTTLSSVSVLPSNTRHMTHIRWKNYALNIDAVYCELWFFEFSFNKDILLFCHVLALYPWQGRFSLINLGFWAHHSTVITLNK